MEEGDHQHSGHFQPVDLSLPVTIVFCAEHVYPHVGLEAAGSIISAIEVGMFGLFAGSSTDSLVTHASKDVALAWTKNKNQTKYFIST